MNALVLLILKEPSSYNKCFLLLKKYKTKKQKIINHPHTISAPLLRCRSEKHQNSDISALHLFLRDPIVSLRTFVTAYNSDDDDDDDDEMTMVMITIVHDNDAGFSEKPPQTYKTQLSFLRILPHQISTTISILDGRRGHTPGRRRGGHSLSPTKKTNTQMHARSYLSLLRI